MSKIYQNNFDSIQEIPDRDSKDFKFYQESKVYKDGKFVPPEDLYPPVYSYFAVYKDGDYFAARKKDGRILIHKIRMSKNDFDDLQKNRLEEIYETEIKDDFTMKIYTLNNIADKKNYIIDRIKKIYKDVNASDIQKVFDKIEITFRKQREKGASNHVTKKIYISYREIRKYDIRTEKEFLDYLKHPKSPLTHEITHIFQNLFKAFPDVKYVKEKSDGTREIDYEKYITDPGEKQARIEQIMELLKWGFTKDEIVQLLYSRKHNDQALWRDLVDAAQEAKKIAKSKLPGDEDKEMEGEELAEDRFHGKKDRGNNYEQDYMSSGTISNDTYPR
jgi:hypothetical protein